MRRLLRHLPGARPPADVGGAVDAEGEDAVDAEEERIAQEVRAAGVRRQVKHAKWIRQRLMDAGLAEDAATASVRHLLPPAGAYGAGFLRKYFHYLDDQGKALDLEATADGIDLTHYLAWLPRNNVSVCGVYLTAVINLYKSLEGSERPARATAESRWFPELAREVDNAMDRQALQGIRETIHAREHQIRAALAELRAQDERTPTPPHARPDGAAVKETRHTADLGALERRLADVDGDAPAVDDADAAAEAQERDKATGDAQQQQECAARGGRTASDERAAGEGEQEIEDDAREMEGVEMEGEERVARATKQEGEGDDEQRDSEDGIMLEDSSDEETVCGAETMAREARRPWTAAQGDSPQRGREPVGRERHDEDGITSASEQAWKRPRLTADSIHP